MTTSIGQVKTKQECETLYGGKFQREVVAIWRVLNVRDSNTDKQCIEIKKIFREKP